MSIVATVLTRVPEPLRSRLHRHRELLKFAIVGGTAFVIDNGIWYSLKLTILEPKPVTAKAVAIIIATIVSYILNREWSFSTRGGRERPHEAALFFLISGIGVAINSMPLYVSRYVLDLEVPHVDMWVQEAADFASGSIIGVLLAMLFRFWAFRRYVFPHANARPRRVVQVARPHA